MSGREKSGPLAATGDLFEGRPWVLTPTRDTDTEVLNLALELVSHCRAVPVVMDADAHDRAAAPRLAHAPPGLQHGRRPAGARRGGRRTACAGRASAT